MALPFDIYLYIYNHIKLRFPLSFKSLNFWSIPMSLKIFTAGTPVSYALIERKIQSLHNNQCWQYNPVSVSDWLLIPFNWGLNMLGYSRSRYTIHVFQFIRFGKATSYLCRDVTFGQLFEIISYVFCKPTENVETEYELNLKLFRQVG